MRYWTRRKRTRAANDRPYKNMADVGILRDSKEFGPYDAKNDNGGGPGRCAAPTEKEESNAEV